MIEERGRERNWRSSKGRSYHPASLERGADLIHGVWTQGLGGSSALDPILKFLPHY